jgi:hypothetical protein
VFYWNGSNVEGPNAGEMDETNALNTGIGGYNDWYVPATFEIMVVYYNLKPTPDGNASASGRNGISVDPYTPNTYYGREIGPYQTTNAMFQVGGSEGYSSYPYWTSCENVGGSAYAVQHNFTNGESSKVSMGYARFHRSIRRVEIP